jgi:hypothetical protein
MGLILGLPLVGLLILAARRRRSTAMLLPEPEPVPARAEVRVSAPAPIQHRDADPPDELASTVEIQVPDDIEASPYSDNEVTVTMEADTDLMQQLEADYAATESFTFDTATKVGTGNDTAEMATAIIEGAATDTAVLNAVAEQVAVKRARTTVLDYNLIDLDSKAPHVHMPSELNGRTNFVERRTSIIEALRAAIERDPLRRDLCMKLLETYHSTVEANRRAFEEFVRLQAGGPNSLSAEDWQKILSMSQEIALEISVPEKKEEDDDLASCA